MEVVSLNKQEQRNRVEWNDKEGLNLQTQSRIRQKERKDQIYKLVKPFSNRSISLHYSQSQYLSIFTVILLEQYFTFTLTLMEGYQASKSS